MMTVGDVMSKINTLRTVRDTLNACIDDDSQDHFISVDGPHDVVWFGDLVDIINGYETLLAMLPVKELGK